MEDWDEWLAELEKTTGLSADVVSDVTQEADPAFRAIRARRLQQEEFERRQLAERAASEKAHTLLLGHLTPEQQTQYAAHQYFDVTSSAGRTFRISVNGSVYLVEDGRTTTSYCIHVDGRFRVPREDGMLAQMLLVQHDEAEFLRIAHASAMR